MKHQTLNFPVDFDKWAASLGTKKPHSASRAPSACRQTLDVSRRLLPRALMRKLFPGHPGLVAAMDGDRGAIATVRFRRDPRPSFARVSRSDQRRAIRQLLNSLDLWRGDTRGHGANPSTEFAGSNLTMNGHIRMDPYTRAVFSEGLWPDADGVSEMAFGTILDQFAEPKSAPRPPPCVPQALNDVFTRLKHRTYRKGIQ